MFGIGWQEIAVILVVALVVVGPDKLPEMAKGLGRAYGNLKRAAQEAQNAVKTEIDLAEAESESDKSLGQDNDNKEAEKKQNPPEKS